MRNIAATMTRTTTLVLIGFSLISLTAGFVLGKRYNEWQIQHMKFVDSLVAINTSSATLRVLDQQRTDTIRAYHESLLKNAASEAKSLSRFHPSMPIATPHFIESLRRAEDYALEHKFADTAQQLQDVRGVLQSRQPTRAVTTP